MSVEDVAEHHRWVSEVRDPAKAASPGEVRVDITGWDATYEVAPVPGGWAWSARAMGSASGSAAPWRRVDTASDAREAALAYIERAVGRPIARPMQPDLFGGAA